MTIFRLYPWPLAIGLACEGLITLAYARMILHRTTPKDVLHRNSTAQRRAGSIRPPCGEPTIRKACAEVAFIIPRLASRLPWRTDCLVQAIAGQTMLMRRRIASKIVVGTSKQPGGAFEAHAWLSCADAVILGGDIGRFDSLLELDNVSAKEA